MKTIEKGKYQLLKFKFTILYWFSLRKRGRRAPSKISSPLARLEGLILRQIFRVVTRYMGSGINGLFGNGIRDQSSGIWDYNPWDRDLQCFVESGIKIRNVFGMRDQNSQRFWDQGSKFSGRNTGSVMKKYTSLRPWNIGLFTPMVTGRAHRQTVAVVVIEIWALSKYLSLACTQIALACVQPPLPSKKIGKERRGGEGRLYTG